MKTYFSFRLCFLIAWVLIGVTGATGPARAQSDSNQDGAATPALPLKLTQAAMCEEIRDYLPYNRAVVFGLAVGRVYCFTSFERIPTSTVIYHNWYRKDRLVTTKRFSLKPPEWATFSSIQLREADKGPWRVEIRDENNQLFQTVRFSITD